MASWKFKKKSCVVVTVLFPCFCQHNKPTKTIMTTVTKSNTDVQSYLYTLPLVIESNNYMACLLGADPSAQYLCTNHIFWGNCSSFSLSHSAHLPGYGIYSTLISINCDLCIFPKRGKKYNEVQQGTTKLHITLLIYF